MLEGAGGVEISSGGGRIGFSRSSSNKSLGWNCRTAIYSIAWSSMRVLGGKEDGLDCGFIRLDFSLYNQVHSI